MYNYQKIQSFKHEDMVNLCFKADLARGRKGRKLKKAVSWLLEEEF